MSRLITDKHDRMMDQTIRRSENLEDMMNKGFRCIRADIKDVRKDFGNLKKETKEIVKSSNGTGELIRQLEGKLEAIDKSVEKYGREIQHSISIAEQSTSEPESDRQQRAKSRRRTESAHGALGSGDHHHQYRSGASRSSNSVRHSGNSGRAHRPNTPSGQIGSRMSDERSTRREYFTELGAAIGPMPDLRDHPAFAASQPVQLPQDYGHGQPGMPVALNGGTYENQSLGDGRWYQQAYGHNH